MKKVIAIAGPTASGKTQISIEIALKLNGIIISADSRQVYKHIPITSAVPSKEERKGIKHYFIEELEPDMDFNAGEFGKNGRKIIKNIFAKGKQPVICGGSGLYLKSLIDGFFEEDAKNKEIKDTLNEKLITKGKEYLYNELMKIDPVTASKITPDFSRRIIRALEVFYTSGKRMSELQKEKIDIDFETAQYGLEWERELLYERINKRVDNMIDNGLILEVKKLIENGFSYKTHNSLNTVGIKEVMKHLEGEYSFDEMVSLIKQNTRRFAKRQITWFKRDSRIKWIQMNPNDDFVKKAEEIIEDFKRVDG